jgi:hypothetical protein
LQIKRILPFEKNGKMHMPRPAPPHKLKYIDAEKLFRGYL